ncbi:MAG: YihY/virulence factor BrkB family protein [Chloroflexota bacterium]|nr:YihY/virulence factor BrkB family protein [Chloroflexota bacterium]
MGNPIGGFMDRHPSLKAFLQKVGQDNIGFLASAVAWTLLTSIVPIVVGLTAITGFFLRDPATQAAVVSHLSSALQGVLSPTEIRNAAKASVQHAGLLGIIGILGIIWGGSNVGGTISTVFQPIFHVRGRSIPHEKGIDVVMILVYTVLMLIILVVTSAGAILNRLVSGFPLPGISTWVIGTAISLVASFLLFAVTYIVFPNTETHFKRDNIWPGAAITAVLFQLLTNIWPIYAHFAHFSKYTAILASLLVLTAWIYFFSLILIVGAEIVSFGALRQAQRQAIPIGPAPNNTVPQHSYAAGSQNMVPVETRQEHDATDHDGAGAN